MKLCPAAAVDELVKLPGVLDVRRSGQQVAVVVENIEAATKALGAPGSGGGVQAPPQCEVVDLNLDEIFEAYVIGKKDAAV